MELLIISKSFVVRESIESVFRREFNINSAKVIYRLKDIPNIELNKYNFIFIEIDKDNITDLDIVTAYKKSLDDIKLLVLDLENNHSLFTKATKLDVDGYILNLNNLEDFVYAVRRIMNGKTYYDIELVQFMLSKKGSIDLSILREREKEVLKQVSQGLSNKDIARNLHITEYTVKKHISSIFNKLHLKSRQDAIVYCKDNYAKVE